MSAYAKLKSQMQLGANIAHVKYVLAWDMAVNMPPGAEMARIRDMATLTALTQDGLVNPDVKIWLEEARQEELGEWDTRNLQRIIEKYKHAQTLPTDMVRKRAEKKALCQAEFKNARANNDWKAILPSFEDSFAMYLQCAKIAGDAMGISPYDYQLRRYANGNSVAMIDPLFMMLRQEIPAIYNAVVQKQVEQEFAPIHMSRMHQLQVAEQIIATMGFDFNHGTLGVAATAFSAGWRMDARIATRFIPGTLKTIFSAIHEAGHAIYKQNLPHEWEGQPVGGDSDKSLHESQSLFFEKQIGYSTAGLRYIYYLLKSADPDFARNNSEENFVARMHYLRPNPVRIYADEVSYPLHIVLRYEMERDLFEEKIRPRDVPEVWRVKTKELFGVDIADDTSGCLQDVHWYKGKFGYFPIYAQGAMYAAQLFDAMKRAIPDADYQIEQGHIKEITHWLSENIHQWGQFYDAPTLIERATGSAPNAHFLLEHLRKRYLNQAE